jgi:serine/threonine-protein kinase HipA
MSICLITGEPSDVLYSQVGLRTLSPRLKTIKALNYDAEQQRQIAAEMAEKVSIQGVQPKFSAVLSPSKGEFQLVEKDGRYILKPPHRDFQQVPENEALTMDLARRAGVETPPFGLVSNIDGTYTYFIQRFDRKGKKNKIATEDFAQLSQESRQTKYRSSLERVAGVVDEYCTFPLPEKLKLWRRVLVSYLTGNEDMHLKNYSLVTENDKTTMSPAYDLLNTTIILKEPKEESALPLNGKKAKLSRSDFVDYYAWQRLGLSPTVTTRILGELESTLPKWHARIERDHLLAEDFKTSYQELVTRRAQVLFAQT